MKVFFHTFGCRVNQYETEALRERLAREGGAEPVDDFEAADLCVVNTCTVTREADKDALRLVRRIARRNPAAGLVVTGCLSTRAPEEVLAAAPRALVVGNEGKSRLPAMLGCSSAPAVCGVGGLAGRERAFLKVQDGCNMSCAYCIIPSVRPALSSKPCAEVLAEARGLVEAGYGELVLCGIRLGRYLSEHEGRRVDLPGLLARLMELPGGFRLRLSSLEVTDVTGRFLDLAAASGGKLAPSFHLPLQSGSDEVLHRMRRWYSAGLFERRVERLRERLPEAGLFTDVMAGFPGETAEDAEGTIGLLERLGFCGLHLFRFSPRAGTTAARWEPVPEGEVGRRMARLRALDARLRSAFAERAVGKLRRVLVERGSGSIEGTAEDFLRVRLDRDPGTALAWARVEREVDGTPSAVVVP